MADLADGLARYLADHGLLDYDPTGVSGDTFMDGMPQTPDEAIAITLYGDGEPDALNDDDTMRAQVRARGGKDPRISRTRLMAIYSQLHGERRVTLPDGTYLILAVALQTPASMGIDDLGRHQHVINFRLDVSSPTEHRPE